MRILVGLLAVFALFCIVMAIGAFGYEKACRDAGGMPIKGDCYQMEKMQP